MDFNDFEFKVSGFDVFLGDDTDFPNRIRVSSVDDLKGFRRIASNTLIRKSERDLWSLSQTDDGDWVIERLFDDDGNPLTVEP